MKNYISILMIICFASLSSAQNSNENLWKEIEQLEADGLTKSALEIVNQIYNTSVADNMVDERIKALLYKSKYMLIIEEEAQLNIVNQFKSEIEASDNLVKKHLLQNILATTYWHYFNQNRYKFYNRSTTDKKISNDFRTWDLQTLFNEIHYYYQSSLQSALILQQEPLSNYSALLIEQEGSKTIRPTLYDLLCHNALEFYKTDENNLIRPSYKFIITDTDLLSDSKTFSYLDIKTKDSLSLQFNALKIYQNLLKFHSRDLSSKAFVYTDIERLLFVTQHATFSHKEKLLIDRLNDKAKTIKYSEQASLYLFEIARIKHRQGLNFNHIRTEQKDNQQWKLKEAVALCNSTIKNYPNSEGAKKCEVLLQQILKPNLRIQAEEYLPINSPSRLLVTYKNLDAINLNIYEVNNKQLTKFQSNYRATDKEQFIKKLKALKTFESSLKTVGDYQEHATEILMPKLSNGLYIIEVKTNSKENVFATTSIQVTDFALIENSTEDKQLYQLINRINGAPIKEAKIQFSYNINNNQSRKRTFTTDSYGWFEVKKDNNYFRKIKIKVTKNDNVAYFGDYYMSEKYEYDFDEDTQYQTYLFTDRSIYRPGQIVYFKGILSQRNGLNTSVIQNEKIKVALYNVNGDKLKELDFTSNEFGSIKGEFILPDSGLNGQYSLRSTSSRIGNQYHSFAVEEYKRPKFRPEFDAITETYKINDTITLGGKATTFAGSNITNAKVVYRVKRNVQYPEWYYWRGPYYNSESQEITFGETLTNEKGKFEIEFKAIPDEGVSKENLPVFNYEVTVDITDINGETRSATTIINVGYHSMTVSINAPETIDKTLKEKDITIEAFNLNGSTIDSKGTIKVIKLNAPDRILRTRPWLAPDFQDISEAQFLQLFPHDAFKNENKIENWEKGEMVYNESFDTTKDKTLTLKKIRKWESGKYVIVAETKDNFGKNVKDMVYVSIYSKKDNTVADNQLIEVQLDKASYQPNDMAELTIGSSAKDITVSVEIEKNHKIRVSRLVKLSDSKKKIVIPILKDDVGGFIIHYSFAFANSFVSKSVRVNVPYPNTDLEIITESFRDRLQPNEEETWRFTIKGPKGDKVTAELLASMYDASLDEFLPHDWAFNPINKPLYYSHLNKNYHNSFGVTNFDLFNRFKTVRYESQRQFDRLNWFGFNFGNVGYTMRKVRAQAVGTPQLSDSFMETEVTEADLEEVVVTGYGIAQEASAEPPSNSAPSSTKEQTEEDFTNIQVRKNFNETAFFFPQLQTDSVGNVSFTFKAPEALTKWKLQLLGHTKTLESTVTQLETATQKELMVIPNAPRFLRQGDEIVLSTKISNLTNKTLSGTVRLELTDPISGASLSRLIRGEAGKNYTVITELTDQAFSVYANNNTNANWTLQIPNDIQVIQYKIVATTGEYSDGEQNALPVLSNRMLVSETLPMWVGSNETKSFSLDKLKTNNSATLKHHKLTLEITSNPAWYAVQALPYLMEYPYDCNEQTFSRYYANALAQHIVTSNPKIEAVFKQWKSSDALISNLEKNQELKNILISETPWLRDAQSESEQKKRIALLFGLNKMTQELQSAKMKLRNTQSNSGAWPWFNGGRDNRYITQHIIAGFGHLKKLNVNGSLEREDERMIQNAIKYLDREFVKEYKDLKKYNDDADLDQDHLSYNQLHYLYVRSFYPEITKTKEERDIVDYYKSQIKSYWLKRSLYARGLMALTMHRLDDSETANKILRSLKDNSITSEELGMYWKENTNSLYWYQAPIETQALLIEAFSEIENDIETIDNLKIWLLKNKQTNQWKTTKATTEAVYALLLQGSSWLDVAEMVDVKVGDINVSPKSKYDVKIEAGSGYSKTSWNGAEINKSMANITMSKKGDGIAWGALYWQYFENLDKISGNKTNLKLNKKLFLKRNTENGELITEIKDSTSLEVGDLIRVRIELRTDRSMEFVHLKDMRASGLEPINVVSQYKWQDGLGYYESTKDASTNFFLDYLPKGAFVFEYDLRVNNAGDMSNGISTIQSMYAPEFSSHSEGIRINVE